MLLVWLAQRRRDEALDRECLAPCRGLRCAGFGVDIAYQKLAVVPFRFLVRSTVRTDASVIGRTVEGLADSPWHPVALLSRRSGGMPSDISPRRWQPLCWHASSFWWRWPRELGRVRVVVAACAALFGALVLLVAGRRADRWASGFGVCVQGAGLARCS